MCEPVVSIVVVRERARASESRARERETPCVGNSTEPRYSWPCDVRDLKPSTIGEYCICTTTTTTPGFVILSVKRFVLRQILRFE